MKTSTIKKLLIYNLVLAGIILIDFILFERVSSIVEFDSFYNTTVKVNNGYRPSFVDRNILMLTSGETFRIGKIPNGDFLKGQKIRIVKSAFSSNIKEVIFLEDNIGEKSVSIFLNKVIFYSLILSIIISIINLFYTNKILTILLVLSTMFMFVFTIGYMLA